MTNDYPKTIMFIPTDLKDVYKRMPFGKLASLSLIMISINKDEYLCSIDRKWNCRYHCGECECERRFKLRKIDLYKWIENNPEFYQVKD